MYTMLGRHSHQALIWIIAILVCATGGYLLYLQSTTEHDIAQSFKEQEAAYKEAKDFKQKAEELARSREQLEAVIEPLSKYGSLVGVYVQNLSNNVSASQNADQSFVSASIFKLFVGYGIYQKIDQGALSLDDTINSYGTVRTIDECLELMITISDNNCAYSLGAWYGGAALDAKLLAEGYTSTQLNNADARGNLNGDKHTTARDVALLLKRLYDGELLSKESTEHFIAYLKADEINNRLPTGLPAGTVIAHKTGDLYGYVHDAGIIYGKDTDVIVVLLTGEWDYPATDPIPVFRGLASRLWNYIGSN